MAEKNSDKVSRTVSSRGSSTGKSPGRWLRARAGQRPARSRSRVHCSGSESPPIETPAGSMCLSIRSSPAATRSLDRQADFGHLWRVHPSGGGSSPMACARDQGGEEAPKGHGKEVNGNTVVQWVVQPAATAKLSL